MTYYVKDLGKWVSEEEAIKYAKRKELGIDTLKDEIVTEILNQLANNYVISFTFTLPTGQTIKVDAKLTKVV